MWQQLAMTALLITALFAMWAAVQALKRRTDPRFRSGDDVMAGCDACGMADICRPQTRADALCDEERPAAGKE